MRKLFLLALLVAGQRAWAIPPPSGPNTYATIVTYTCTGCPVSAVNVTAALPVSIAGGIALSVTVLQSQGNGTSVYLPSGYTMPVLIAAQISGSVTIQSIVNAVPTVTVFQAGAWNTTLNTTGAAGSLWGGTGFSDGAFNGNAGFVASLVDINGIGKLVRESGTPFVGAGSGGPFSGNVQEVWPVNALTTGTALGNMTTVTLLGGAILPSGGSAGLSDVFSSLAPGHFAFPNNTGPLWVQGSGLFITNGTTTANVANLSILTASPFATSALPSGNFASFSFTVAPIAGGAGTSSTLSELLTFTQTGQSAGLQFIPGMENFANVNQGGTRVEFCASPFMQSGGTVGGNAVIVLGYGATRTVTTTVFLSATFTVESTYTVNANAAHVEVRAFITNANTASIYVDTKGAGNAGRGSGMFIRDSDGWVPVVGQDVGANLSGTMTIRISSYTSNAQGGNLVAIKEEDKP